MPVTRQGLMLKEKTTENELSLELLREAFGRLVKECSVRVNTECGHVLNVMQNHWLPLWEKNGWKNAKGRPVKNAELWQQCRELMDRHVVSFGAGEHSYRKVMQADIKREMEKAEACVPGRAGCQGA